MGLPDPTPPRKPGCPESGADPDATTQSPARLSLKARALGLLSRREHSRAELARKLSAHTDDTQALQALLDELAREQWLSDERYAQSLIHRQAQRLGTRRIVNTLREQGVDADSVAELTAQLRDTEEARARAVWQKKFGTPPKDAREHARQWRFMAYRGFSSEALRRVIADAQAPARRG